MRLNSPLLIWFPASSIFSCIKLGRNRQSHCPSLCNPPFAISIEVIPFPAAEIIRLSSYLLELSPILFAFTFVTDMKWKTTHPKMRMAGHTWVIVLDAAGLSLQSALKGQIFARGVLLMPNGAVSLSCPTLRRSSHNHNLEIA